MLRRALPPVLRGASASGGTASAATRAVERALERVLVAREHGEQRGQVGRVPAPVHVGLGKRDVAAGQHLARDAPVVEREIGRARGAGVGRVARAEAMREAVGRAQRQRAVGEALEQREQQARRRRAAQLRRRAAGQRRVGRWSSGRLVAAVGGPAWGRTARAASQSCSACQWMRAITPSVNSGSATAARARRRATAASLRRRSRREQRLRRRRRRSSRCARASARRRNGSGTRSGP